MRDNPKTNFDGEYYKDYDFDQFSINCNSLSGIFYKNYVFKVHHLICVFVKMETSATYIKPRENKLDGRFNL